MTIYFLSAYNDVIGSRDVATRISESPLDLTYQFLPMLYLVVFSNIGLADCEKRAKEIPDYRMR